MQTCAYGLHSGAHRARPEGHDGRVEQKRTGDKPVGRRVVLSLLGLGAVGVVTGRSVQTGLEKVLGPVELHDPTGIISLLPAGDSFRFYSVTGSVPTPDPVAYRLKVSGLVHSPGSYSLTELAGLPQTDLVRDFHCVTGWQVLSVPWQGVRLSHLLAAAGPTDAARAIRFHSFDGTYTENMTLSQARRDDVLVALRMQGKPVTHNHGGPVRIYSASMFGYKSTKWLSEIEVVDHVEPGYWENRGYDLNGFIQ
jgi:DMSO/TMAO reductase YedYZ molybdopterin-dependent catalytic subunit